MTSQEPTQTLVERNEAHRMIFETACTTIATGAPGLKNAAISAIATSLALKLRDALAAHSSSATMRAALVDLIEAVTREVNDPAKGGSGYLLARLSDARAALNAGGEGDSEKLDYQSIAAEQGNIILRLRMALQVARAWGIRSEAFDALVAHGIAKWVDAGMTEPVPFFDSAFFEAWAAKQGLSNINGKLGYRLLVDLAKPAPPTPAKGEDNGNG